EDGIRDWSVTGVQTCALPISRKITHITEIMGMEGDVIVTQDVFLYDIEGEDAKGHIIGRHRSTGIGRPRFWERARYYGEEKRLRSEERRVGKGRRKRKAKKPA